MNSMNDKAAFLIHVEWNGCTVRVSGPDMEFVTSRFETLEEKFLGSHGAMTANSAGTMPSASGKKLSLQEFVRAVAPKSGPEYVATIGFYLEHHAGMESFTSADIREGFVAVKFNIKNPPDAVSKARSGGKIMDNGDKTGFVVTQSGEEWVQARLSG